MPEKRGENKAKALEARSLSFSLAQSHNEERVIILQIHKQYTATETEARAGAGEGAEGAGEEVAGGEKQLKQT